MKIFYICSSRKSENVWKMTQLLQIYYMKLLKLAFQMYSESLGFEHSTFPQSLSLSARHVSDAPCWAGSCIRDRAGISECYVKMDSLHVISPSANSTQHKSGWAFCFKLQSFYSTSLFITAQHSAWIDRERITQHRRRQLHHINKCGASPLSAIQSFLPAAKRASISAPEIKLSRARLGWCVIMQK